MRVLTVYSPATWRSPLLFGCALIVAMGSAQAPAPTEPGKQGPPPNANPGQDKPKPKPGQPKPYDEVITKEAVTQEGMFKVHRIDDKVYFEIPASMYGRDMLWQTELSEVPNGISYIGASQGARVVTFTRRNNTVHLRHIDHKLRAKEDGGTRIGVDAASLQTILMAFPVEAEGQDKSAVIDVTRLFTSDPPEFSAKNDVGGQSVDQSRSYIDKVKAFPSNVETRSLLTWNGGAFSRSGLSSVSALVHYSLALLPEKPMMGRLADSRVGYFVQTFEEYGRPDHRARTEAYISRFRLEKKDPNAEISDPVKPITFYLSREVPEKWRKWIKLGVEDWKPAFERAGFRNAVVCVDAPSRQQDPDWDPEDARYSVIRWAPSTTQNAMGPSIQDPRSGETISAHIIVWHNILQLIENWYFVQAAPMDPRAARLPFPDDLMGEMLRYVVSHEVGHTLGLRHNHKASSAYTIAQLRDPKWTHEWGNEASIMDYGRANYVAQPGDGARLIPKLGPYDYFAIEWGYKPIPSARTSEDEKPILDQVAARQIENAMLRFGSYESGWGRDDPTARAEDLGDDAIEATRLGMLNIRRVAKMILPATERLGEDYSLASNLYQQVQYQRMLELEHVANLVGGYVETDYRGGRGGEVFAPVSAKKQAQAIQFLLANAFQTPQELLDPALLNRIKPYGQLDTIVGVQRTTLNTLLNERRISRMFDYEAAKPTSAYPVARMIGDLQSGIWSEISLTQVKIDPYRRNLQRVYLQTIDSRLNGSSATKTELKGIAKDSIRTLARTIDKAIPKATDKATALHLSECRAEIERILKPPSVVVTTPPTQPLGFPMGVRPFGRLCSHGHGPIDSTLHEEHEDHP